MKRLFTVIMCGVLLFSCSGQRQEPDIPTPSLSFSDQCDAGYTGVTITCSVTGNMSAERLIIEYDKEESLASAQRATFESLGKDFSVSVSGLEAQTTYYYRYTVENRISTYTDSKVRQFTTRGYTSPVILTLDAEALSGTRATLKSQLEDTGGRPVSGRGFLLGTDKSNLEQRPAASPDGTLQVEGLSFGTTYYYQAYASSEVGTGVGEIKEFTTCSAVTFKPVEVKDVSATGAVVTGGIESDGGVTIEVQGFRLKMEGSDEYSFIESESESTLSGLKPNVKYRVWYYARTCDGEFESGVTEFVTSTKIAVTSITLNKTSLSLTKGASETLTATVMPDDATDKSVTWTSSNTSVATVSGGMVTAVGGGSAIITASAGGKSATCAVTVTQPGSGPEAVDLGLSVKWASYNVGATKPEECGDYFAWGETEPKSNYDWSTYKWCNGSGNSLTKYNTSSSYGTVDNKTQLEMSDDAARANWGGKWRMPTKAEIEELHNDCTWTWTTRNGVNGYQVTSKKNGNSIFLPAAGYLYGTGLGNVGSSGDYWSSSLDTVGPDFAWYVYFNSVDVRRSRSSRCNGRSVRPVSE